MRYKAWKLGNNSYFRWKEWFGAFLSLLLWEINNSKNRESCNFSYIRYMVNVYVLPQFFKKVEREGVFSEKISYIAWKSKKFSIYLSLPDFNSLNIKKVMKTQKVLHSILCNGYICQRERERERERETYGTISYVLAHLVSLCLKT